MAEKKDTVPICYCKNLSREQLEEAIRSGAHTVDKLRQCTGATSKCYGCLADIEQMLYLEADHHHEAPSGLGAVTRLVPGMRTLRRQMRAAVKAVRQEVRWHAQPWKLGTFVIEQTDLHSRVVMTNLECPHESHAFRDWDVAIDLFTPDGTHAGRVNRLLKRNHTLILETRELMSELGVSAPFFGMLEASYHNRYVRSGRCYTQWYNDVSLTASHERRFRSIFPARLHGYEAVHRVMASERYLTYPVVANCRSPRFTTHARLANAQGEVLRSRALAIPGMGTLFRPITQLFPEAESFLDGREGVVYLDTVGPLMTYYLIQDRQTGGWQGQHLE